MSSASVVPNPNSQSFSQSPHYATFIFLTTFLKPIPPHELFSLKSLKSTIKLFLKKYLLLGGESQNDETITKSRTQFKIRLLFLLYLYRRLLGIVKVEPSDEMDSERRTLRERIVSEALRRSNQPLRFRKKLRLLKKMLVWEFLTQQREEGMNWELKVGICSHNERLFSAMGRSTQTLDESPPSREGTTTGPSSHAPHFQFFKLYHTVQQRRMELDRLHTEEFKMVQMAKLRQNLRDRLIWFEKKLNANWNAEEALSKWILNQWGNAVDVGR